MTHTSIKTPPDRSGAPARDWWRPVLKTGREVDAGLIDVCKIKHRDSAIPFWALMAFTLILFISPQSFIRALAPLRIALITVALAVFTYLLDRFSSRRPVLEFTREAVITAYLLGWAILTLPLSYWPGGSIEVLVDIYVKTLVVFWLLSHVVNTVPRLRYVAWALSLIAVPLALTALANLASGNYMHGFAPEASRIPGYNAPLTANPNDLALTLNLILPLSVALFLGVRKPAARAALLACICLDAIAIIATFSRAGFLTLGVTFAAYLWALFKRGQRRWAFLALFLVFAAMPFLPSGYLDRLSTITNIETDATGSAQARWGDTIAAMEYVAHHPIVGAGLGMDSLALNEVRGPVWKEIHDVYLQYAVDLGIPGLSLFLLLFARCLKSARDAQRQSDQGPERGELFYLAEGIQVSLLAFAVAAFFHPVAYNFYFYYIGGLALAAKMVCATGPTEGFADALNLRARGAKPIAPLAVRMRMREK